MPLILSSSAGSSLMDEAAAGDSPLGPLLYTLVLSPARLFCAPATACLSALEPPPDELPSLVLSPHPAAAINTATQALMAPTDLIDTLIGVSSWLDPAQCPGRASAFVRRPGGLTPVSIDRSVSFCQAGCRSLQCRRC